MVATLEDLACLDLIVWLRTGANAARRLGISQPKVSRAVQSVTEVLGVSMAKKEGESSTPRGLNSVRLTWSAAGVSWSELTCLAVG